MLEKLTRDMFAACQHTQFRVLAGPAASVDLELAEVSPLTALHRQEVFSLLFRGPSSPGLPQRTYRLVHDRLGELDIFLVPVGQDERGLCYQAVFNRLVEPGATGARCEQRRGG